TSEAEVRCSIDIVYQRIAVAAQRVDRAPEDIRLLPVSKTVPEDRMRAAYAAGLRQFGENKVQEAQTKAEAMNDLDVHWAVIGALQSNKTRDVAQFAHEFQALDRLRIARRLDHDFQVFGRSLNIYDPVNASREHTKSVLHPDAVEYFLERSQAFHGLKGRNLISIAVHNTDEAVIRQNFAVVRVLRDELRE